MEEHIAYVQTMQKVILGIIILLVSYQLGRFYIRYRIFKETHGNIKNYIQNKALDQQLKAKTTKEKLENPQT